MSNQAAWIKEKHGRLVLDEAETPFPGDNEVLVKVELIAFSPIESKIQTFGTHPIPYPNILGQSFVGAVQSIRRSQRNRPETRRQYRKYARSQSSRRSSLRRISEIRPSVCILLLQYFPRRRPPRGCGLNCEPRRSGVCVVDSFGLDRPPLSGKPEPKNKKVLIYGGSSSTGRLAVRYAATTGYTVVTTSSPQNREFVESLDPVYIIDHTTPAETIAEELRSHGPFDRTFDTIGLPPVTNNLVKYISSIGGGKYNTLIPPIGGEGPVPDNVERLFAPYSWALEEEANWKIARWLFEKYLSDGLQSILVVPTRVQVVEGGLDNVQHALDLIAQNAMSGHKLVLNPWAR